MDDDVLAKAFWAVAIMIRPGARNSRKGTRPTVGVGGPGDAASVLSGPFGLGFGLIIDLGEGASGGGACREDGECDGAKSVHGVVSVRLKTDYTTKWAILDSNQ